MLKNKQTKLPKKAIKIPAVGLCILVLCGLLFFVGSLLLKYIETPERLRKIAEENIILGGTIYILMVFFQVVAAFIPGEPFDIVGGFSWRFFGRPLCVFVGKTLWAWLCRNLFSCRKTKFTCFFKTFKKTWFYFLLNISDARHTKRFA